MGRIVSLLALIFALASCQSDTPSGNEILFGDVIGSYEGVCADYTTSTSELINRENATLSIIAASPSLAGVKASCNRIMDIDLPIKSASAAKIEFEKETGNSLITMTYIAVSDSIVILQTMNGQSENLIFTGKRK